MSIKGIGKPQRHGFWKAHGQIESFSQKLCLREKRGMCFLPLRGGGVREEKRGGGKEWGRERGTRKLQEEVGPRRTFLFFSSFKMSYN